MFFRKRPKQSIPFWLKGAIAIFIAYALLIHKNDYPQHPIQQPALKNEPVKENKPAIDLSDYKTWPLTGFSAPLRVKNLASGEGVSATCGQEVSIAYDVFLPDNTFLPIGSTKENPLRFHLGGTNVIPALEQGVTGMKPGGTRSIYAPADMAYGDSAFNQKDGPKDSAIRFEVQMLAAKPALPDSESSPYRVVITREGNGAIALCGSIVKANITVWGLDGKKFYSTKDEGHTPITFTLGKSEVFLGLEQGAFGMAPGAMRTLIVPPDFQKTMFGAAPVIKIPLPPQQTVLVDIEALN